MTQGTHATGHCLQCLPSSGLTSPYLCPALDWSPGPLAREGEGSSGPPPSPLVTLFSPSLTVLCSVFSLGSASLDSAAHSPAGRPGRLLTWRLVLGTGHLESEIIMSRIMPGVV